MEKLQFEPMSVGQIIDKTFWLWRKNFVRYIVLVAIVLVPLFILQTMVQLALANSGGSSERAVGGIVRILAVALLGIIGQNLSRAALMKSISQSYLGEETTVGQAYRSMIPKLGSIIWASILVGLICVVGFLLLVVPGIIFALWFSLTIPVLILENGKASPSLGRSKSLVSGNLGKVFVVGLVVFLITIVIGWVFGFIGGFIAGGNNSPIHVQLFVNGLSQLAAEILAMPIGAGAYILLYYDLRIRKEGFDLEMLARSMSQESENANGPTVP